MFQIDFNKPIHVFFSGIGGISMSGLAEILRSRGFTVSGSDRTASPITEELVSHGIPVVIGQKRENITPSPPPSIPIIRNTGPYRNWESPT